MAEKFSITKITPNLYVSGWPKGENAVAINQMNFDLILHLLWQKTDRRLKAGSVDLERIVVVDSPLLPMPMKQLAKGVKKALPIIEGEGKVLVYCKSGVHRSVAMACCILIAQGYTAEESMTLVRKKRPTAKPETPYIKKRIIMFEKYWDAKKAK